MSFAGFMVREGWRAWRRSTLAGGLAVASLMILASSLLIFWGLHQSVEIARDSLLGGFEIEAFVTPGRERNLTEVSARLASRDGVASADTVTKEQAAELFAERHGEDLVALLEENPLPASVILSYDPGAITAERLALEASEILADPDIEDVAFEGELLSRFEEVSDRTLLIAGTVGAVIMLISILLTMQSVRIAARTGESWAKAVFLIGGTRGQVGRPLAVSGMISGLLGGGIGVLLVTVTQSLLASSKWVASPDWRAMVVALALPVLVGWLSASGAWKMRN
ncbi:MAG TPA: hypothetical protein ENH10_06120 [Bacteroidetes bacterium]|nr:cell division ABC transporter subunit FtsX [bacterium BMS3Bbin04]HDO65595.1 hypothetical protein [Bacteroidota bacterium]HEX04720.1 hypothetical protein [Bacteroidota bacterium]